VIKIRLRIIIYSNEKVLDAENTSDGGGSEAKGANNIDKPDGIRG
jgi:hypothetical protein